MGGLFRNVRILVAALLGRPSPLRIRVEVPAGWTSVLASGDRNYNEYQSPSEQASIRVFAFESSATTLDDMIRDDLSGIRTHKGAVIGPQSRLTLGDGTPAYRIEYSIEAEEDTRYGVDLMADIDTGSVLMSLLSQQPITPALLVTFNSFVDSVRVSRESGPAVRR